MGNGGLVDAYKGKIALHASAEHIETRAQIEPPQHLGELPARRVGPHEVPVGHRSPFEQAPVPAQDDSLFPACEPRKVFIRDRIAVLGVEAEHSQESRQFAKVNVEGEPSLAQRRCPHARQIADIPGFKHRVDAEEVGVIQLVLKTHGLPVCKDEVDLGVRYAEILDEGLGSASLHKTDAERDLAPRGGKKIVQLLVESDGHRGHTCIV